MSRAAAVERERDSSQPQFSDFSSFSVSFFSQFSVPGVWTFRRHHHQSTSPPPVYRQSTTFSLAPYFSLFFSLSIVSLSSLPHTQHNIGFPDSLLHAVSVANITVSSTHWAIRVTSHNSLSSYHKTRTEHSLLSPPPHFLAASFRSLGIETPIFCWGL